MVEDELETTIKKLQKKIDDDEEQTYSKVVIREYRNPANFGVLKHPNAVGIIKGPCGDTMKISIEVIDGQIQDARFWTDGCGATLACGNMLTKTIIGKTLRAANKVNSKQLLDDLDGLPKEHDHCALLAVNALHEAINNYEIQEKVRV